MTNLKNIVLKNIKSKEASLQALNQPNKELDNQKNIPLLMGNNMNMFKDLMHQLSLSSMYFDNETKNESTEVLKKMKIIEEHLNYLKDKNKEYQNKLTEIDGSFCNSFYKDLCERKVVSINIRIVKPLKKQKQAFLDLCNSLGWICCQSSSKFITFYAVIDNVQELKGIFNNVLAIDNSIFCQSFVINNTYGRFQLLKDLEVLVKEKD